MKVLICDDQALIRDGLEMLLKLERDIEVVGQAQDGAEAVEQAARNQPDLVLMDLKMPGMNGIEATRQLRNHVSAIFTKLDIADRTQAAVIAIRHGLGGG